MSNGNSTTFDEDEIDVWERKLGQGGKIKVSRTRPKDNLRRTKMNNAQAHQVTTPPRSRPPSRPAPFLEKIALLSNLQEKRDKLQEEVREIEAERDRVLKDMEARRAQALSVRREAESQIYAQLEAFDTKRNPRELGAMQSQMIRADAKEAEEIRQATKTLGDIAQKATQLGIKAEAENYLKTAEAFRLIWQGLTPEQREERALVARVSPDNAKAFYRAAIAYHQEELAAKFLEMIPPQWRADIEGKAPIPVEEGEAES